MKLSDFKISIRIYIAIILPVAGMLLFSSYIMADQYKISKSATKLSELVTIAPDISALIHEMQKERGLSAGYIGSNGSSEFRNKLNLQRKNTNKAVEHLKVILSNFDSNAYGEVFSNKVKASQSSLSKLSSVRGKVTNLELTVSGMAGYYTSVIVKNMGIIAYASVLSTDAGVTKAVASYENYLQAKEHAGIERAMGANGFGKGIFSPGVYQKFVSLISAQRVFLSRFKTFASDDQVQFHKDTVKGADVDKVNHLRRIALDVGTGGRVIANITGSYWFETITKKIDLMKQVEDKIAEDLMGMIANSKSVAKTSLLIAQLVSFAMIIVVAVLGIKIVSTITRPVYIIISSINELIGGELGHEISGTERKDEIGDISRAMEVFREGLVKAKRLQEEQELDQKIKLEFASKLEKLTDNFDISISAFLDELAQSMDGLSVTSSDLNCVAGRSEEQSQSLISSSNTASGNVNTVASASEELSASIQEIVTQITLSSDIARDSVVKAKEVNQAIKGLKEGSDKIGEVVDFIKDIAEQTNLLALNATIEAARAGEAGKGFAVVASEVKALAAQTAKATEDIEEQVIATQKSTLNTANAISEVSITIEKMDEIATSISAAMEEQSAAMSEIVRSTHGAAESTNEVAGIASGITESASETNSAASNLGAATDDINKRTTDLRNEVEVFLANIKAA